MFHSLSNLSYHVKIYRDRKKISQEKLAETLGAGINRSQIAHLEQGLRIPKKEVLEKICRFLEIPDQFWAGFTDENSQLRINFEVCLSELIGIEPYSLNLDETAIKVVEGHIYSLFNENLSEDQAFGNCNSILVFYGVKPISVFFYKKYLKTGSFRTIDTFNDSVTLFLKDAIRLFSTVHEAFDKLNCFDESRFNDLLKPLSEKDPSSYTTRTDWNRINRIPDEELPYLGYIAAGRVKQEEKERKELSDFLKLAAKGMRESKDEIAGVSTKKKRRMDSLLRKFNTKIEHGLFSPLFKPDAEMLEREAEYISPTKSHNFDKMEKTQATAYSNLAHYLTADYMDIYVATSMRADSDFVSVNEFVETLFKHSEIRQFKLRYFNPTQSWIEDRVAKGLVEALMLKRADICIYMAQKEDTFGKDSEASVTLGHGKPVIVYVPKLYFPEKGIDTEKFGISSRAELIRLVQTEEASSSDEIDDASDIEAIHSTLLGAKLRKLSSQELNNLIRSHWADFDLFGEIEKRVTDDKLRTLYKSNLNSLIYEKKLLS
jgi:transcriptional regulator with XRE-family HTH domain